MYSEYFTLHNARILFGRHFRTPVLKTGRLFHAFCPGSEGDAKGTFSQTMGGVTFFTVNYWRRELFTCDTSIVGAKANYVSDDTSARLRFQRPIDRLWKSTLGSTVDVSSINV